MKIKIRFSAAALFGNIDPADENIDEGASILRYCKQLERALKRDYNDVEIVQSIGDDIRVNGMTDHDEVPYIEQVVHNVWDAWDWVVYRAR